jgi:hypothetical protein
MTIQGNDPEISFNPSAPPPPDNVPIATATAIPIVSATAVPTEPSNTGNQSSSLLPNGSNIERITNSDGSLSVKVTKTSTQSDGYRSVRIEHYLIPTNMASTVIQSMDLTGEAPSSLYLIKIEDHRLPPERSVEEAVHRPPGPSVGIAGGGGGAVTNTAVVIDDGDARTRRNRMVCCVAVSIFVLFWVIGFMVSSTHTKETYHHAPSPSYDDDFFNPLYPTPSYSYPTPPFQTYPTNPVSDDWLSEVTMPPILNAPPTKSPAPSSTPYPTWDHYPFSWLITPPPNNVHPRAVIISPTFSKKHTPPKKLNEAKLKENEILWLDRV